MTTDTEKNGDTLCDVCGRVTSIDETYGCCGVSMCPFCYMEHFCDDD